jgi:hypothetical protein
MSPYVIAVALALGGSYGFYAGYRLQQSRIDALQADISLTNAKGEALLRDARQKAVAAQKEAIAFNKQLDDNYVAHQKEIDGLNASLRIVKLRDPGKKGCPNAVPNSGNTTKNPANEAESSELSDSATGFLWAMTWKADKLAADYNYLLSFVGNKCGIK